MISGSSGRTEVNEKENNDGRSPAKRTRACADNVAQQPVDLDEERQERMRRNQQILQQLGLMPMMQSMRSTVAVVAEAKKAPAPPRKRRNDGNTAGEERVLRRSLRTRGQEPDLPPLLLPLFNRQERERPYSVAGIKLPAPRPRATAAEGGGGSCDASKFDAHNLHRLRTMSDEAMQKRIHKITNTLKLKSLVQLLQQFGRHELAEEAQSALDARLANV